MSGKYGECGNSFKPSIFWPRPRGGLLLSSPTRCIAMSSYRGYPLAGVLMAGLMKPIIFCASEWFSSPVTIQCRNCFLSCLSTTALDHLSLFCPKSTNVAVNTNINLREFRAYVFFAVEVLWFYQFQTKNFVDAQAKYRIWRIDNKGKVAINRSHN